MIAEHFVSLSCDRTVVLFPFSTFISHSASVSFRISLLLSVINTKNCSLSIVLTATDQKPQKSLKR